MLGDRNGFFFVETSQNGRNEGGIVHETEGMGVREGSEGNIYVGWFVVFFLNELRISSFGDKKKRITFCDNNKIIILIKRKKKSHKNNFIFIFFHIFPQ